MMTHLQRKERLQSKNLCIGAGVHDLIQYYIDIDIDTETIFRGVFQIDLTSTKYDEL